MSANVARLRQDMALAVGTIENAMVKVRAAAALASGGLAAVGIALSVDQFRLIAKASIDMADRMNDIADATGATVEQISELATMARRSGASIDTVEGALIKFNAALRESATAGSDGERAIQAVGLQAKVLRDMDPALAIRELAKALGQFENDQNKAQVVATLFGKSLKEIAPLLNDLASGSAAAASVTASMAARAEAFNKQLATAKTAIEDAAQSITFSLLPSITRTVQEFNAGMEAAGGFGAAILLFGTINPFRNLQGNLQTVRADIEDAKKRLQFNAVSEGAKASVQAEISALEKKLNYLQRIQAIEAQANPEQNFDSNPRIRGPRSVLPDLAGEKERERLAKEYQRIVDQINSGLESRSSLLSQELWMGREMTASERVIFDVRQQIKSSTVAIKAVDQERLMLAAKQVARLIDEASYLKSIREQAAGLQQLREEGEDEISRALAEQSGLYAQNTIAAYDAAVAAKQQAQSTELEATLLTATNRERATAVEQLLMMQRIEQERERLRRLNISEAQRAELLAKFEATALVARETAIRQFEIAEFQKTFEQIGDALTQEIMRGGKSAGRLLTDYFKTLVLQPIIKAVVNPVAMGLTSALGFGATAAQAGQAAQAASSLQNFSSLANIGSGIGAAYSAATGSLITSLGSAATSIGSTIGSSAIAEFGLGMQGLALPSSTGALAAGAQASSFLTSAAAAGPYVLAAVAALNALGVFRSERKVNSGLVGTLGSGDISDANVIRKGGTLFNGPEYRTEIAGISQTSKALQDAFIALRTVTADQAKALGLSSDAVLAFTTRLGSDSINNDAGTLGLSLDGLTSEQAQQKIAQALVTANEELARFALGTTVFTRQGESAVQTLARLSGSVTAVNSVLSALGQSAFDTSLAGAELASKLADAFGGLSNFSQATGSFFDNFFTDREKLDSTIRQVGAAFAALNLPMPELNRNAAGLVINGQAARSAFRDLVEAQDKTTDSGRRNYAALLQVAGAFAQITPVAEAAASAVRSAEDIERERLGLERELLQIQGNTNALLGLERAELDASNRALFDRIQALKQEQKVTAERQAALDAFRGIGPELVSPLQFRQFQIAELISGFARLGITLTEGMIDGANAANTFTAAMQAYEAGNYALAQSILQAVPTLQQVSTAWRSQTAEAQRLVRVAEQQSSLETRLLQLQGDAVELRRRELQALEPENRALLQQIFALEDAAAAADAAKAAQEEYNQALSSAQSNLEAARRAVEAAQGSVDGIREQATNNYISALERVDNIQQRIADQARQVGIEYGRLADSLFGYLDGQLQPPSAQFGEALKKALSGDRDALSVLPGLATSAIEQARNQASTSVEAEIARSKVLSGVAQAAKVAEEKRAAEADAAKNLQQELLQAQKDQAEALRIANIIGAATVRTQEDLVAKFKGAEEALKKAIEDQVKAQAALDAIKTNTGTTSMGLVDAVKTLKKLRVDVIAELIKGFDGIDLNLDGVIDYAEFAKPFAGLATDARLKAIFEEIDANGDGVISKLETIRAGVVVDLPKKFDTLDTSLDTLLSIEEFKKGYAGLASNAELTKIFTELDTNGDGVLTKLEAISKNTATTATNTGTSLGTVTFNPSAALKSVFDGIREGTRLQLVQLLGTQNINNELVVTGAFNTSFDGIYKLQFESREHLKAISANTTAIVTHTLNTAAEIVKIANRTNKPQVVFDRGTSAGGVGGAVFAKGGAFTNSIVSRPTVFPMGLMGEEGDEAIMPLANVGGSLGVRAVGPNNARLVQEMRALRDENTEIRSLLAESLRELRRTANATNGRGEAPMLTEAIA